MMFRFRLERILLYRKRRVDACTRDVARAQVKLEVAEQEAAASTHDLERSRCQSVEDRLVRLDAMAMARQLAWHEALQLRSQELEAKAKQACYELQTARQRLQQAWQEREVLQQLKERQQREWAQVSARRERRDMDEVGLMQAVLRSRDDSSDQRSSGLEAGSFHLESDGA